LKDVENNNAIFWSGVERFSTQLVQFLLGIYLARILLPSDFGLIGMLAIFIGIGEIISDGGFFRALVQKSQVKNEEYSSVFWINVIISLAVFICLFFISPYVATFYNEPSLEILLVVLSSNVIIKSLSIVQRAKLTISLDFKTLSYISLISVLFSGFLAIYLANNDYGVWALVIQITIRNLIFLIICFLIMRWIPSPKINFKSVIELFRYGSNLLLVGLIDVFFINIYNVIIGKYYSKNDLGFYSRAQQFNDIVAINVTSIIQRVAFSSLSKVKKDNAYFLKQYRSFLRMGNYIIVPISLALIVLAESLITVILTDKWIQAAPFLKLLSVIGIFYFVNSLSITFLNSKGFSKEFLKIEIIKKTLILFVLALTYKNGIEQIIYGQIFVATVSLYLNTIYNYKFTSYNFISLLKDILPTIVLGVISFFIVDYILNYINSDFYKIICGLTLGFALYFLMTNLFRIEESNKLIRYLKA
tara:strand:- start:13475 stop:14896 length:1422 start_codon:yes stop_codon:yes gene_type:complete